MSSGILLEYSSFIVYTETATLGMMRDLLWDSSPLRCLRALEGPIGEFSTSPALVSIKFGSATMQKRAAGKGKLRVGTNFRPPLRA
jgi:hypothetical protein